jgi:hypothetical protein
MMCRVPGPTCIGLCIPIITRFDCAFAWQNDYIVVDACEERGRWIDSHFTP